MFQIQDRGIRRAFVLLIILSAVVRAFLGATLELGNDEVYYRIFAVYPDLSHFDHPPMVGWIIQLFSLNLILDSELFIRLSSILFGVVNLFLIFLIGREVRDERTGLFAALRELDDPGIHQVYARCPVGGGVAYAVQNRLKKAAAFHIVDAEEEA